MRQAAHLSAVYLRYCRPQVDRVPCQKCLGSACRGLSLGDSVTDILGGMGRPGDKKTRYGKIHRSQFDVILEKIPVRCSGKAEDDAQIFRRFLISDKAGAQDQTIRGDPHFAPKHRFGKGDGDPVAIGGRYRSILHFVRQ